MEKLKVKAYCINKGQPGQYYGLKYADDDAIVASAPDNWKTYKGAVHWALAHGMEVVEDSVENGTAKKYKTRKTKQEILQIIIEEFEKAHQKAKGNPYVTSEASMRETALLDLMKKIEIYDAN